MTQCPLCDKNTYEEWSPGNWICRASDCGWTGKPLSCADIGGDEAVEKMYPFMIEAGKKRHKRYMKLKREYEAQEKE